MPSQTLQQPFETLFKLTSFWKFLQPSETLETETRVVMHGGCATELD